MSIVFVKSSVDFNMNGRAFKFENLDLIEEGIPELCKITNTSTYDFSLDTSFEVTVRPSVTFKIFKLESQIFVERDMHSSVYGLRFISKNDDLLDLLGKHGKPFTKWKRSSPRIPSNIFSSAVPNIRIMVKTEVMNNFIPLEILNISLGGVGLFGIADNSQELKINDVALCKVEGNGFDVPLDFTARVMRITTSADLFRNKRNTVVNQFGMKFVEFDEENKKRFLDLINKILSELKKN